MWASTWRLSNQELKKLLNDLLLFRKKNLLSQIPGIELVAVCRDSMEVYEYLKQHTADLAILDVEMPGMSGLELIRTLTQKPAIILSTANPDYAADAFDLDVADFIVKPVSLPRLLKSISKINALLRQDARHENNNPPVPGRAISPCSTPMLAESK